MGQPRCKPLKTSSFHAMLFLSTLENVVSSTLRKQKRHICKHVRFLHWNLCLKSTDICCHHSHHRHRCTCHIFEGCCFGGCFNNHFERCFETSSKLGGCSFYFRIPPPPPPKQKCGVAHPTFGVEMKCSVSSSCTSSFVSTPLQPADDNLSSSSKHPEVHWCAWKRTLTQPKE